MRSASLYSRRAAICWRKPAICESSALSFPAEGVAPGFPAFAEPGAGVLAAGPAAAVTGAVVTGAEAGELVVDAGPSLVLGLVHAASELRSIVTWSTRVFRRKNRKFIFAGGHSCPTWENERAKCAPGTSAISDYVSQDRISDYVHFESAGSSNQNVLPLPTILDTPISPPCASTASRQKVRPSPVPVRVRPLCTCPNFSKIRR